MLVVGNSITDEGKEIRGMAKKIGAVIKKYIIIAVGCIIYAAGIALFLDPNHLAPGGITGIGILLSHFTGAQTGTVVFLLNIPLLLLGFWKFGGEFLVSTFFASAVSSGCINIIGEVSGKYGLITENLILAGAVGGVLMALGMGIIFKQGATTAGSDIIIKVLRQKHPQIKTGTFYMITDSLVITASAIYFRNIEIALFAAVALVISSAFLDLILYGAQGAKLLYIISDHSEQIVNRILKEVDIGATILDGKGAFSKTEKEIVLCAVRNYNFMKVREIIRQEDKAAFVIVSGANEIYGEGYKGHYEQEI